MNWQIATFLLDRVAAEEVGGDAELVQMCDVKRRAVRICLMQPAEMWDRARVALATMALPYAGHPDYREEWRP